MAAMSTRSRFSLRPRRQAPDWHGIALYALLLAIGIVMALPGPLAEAEADVPQCGNIQSSTVVIIR